MGLEGIMVSARKHNTTPTIVPVPAEPAMVKVRSFRVLMKVSSGVEVKGLPFHFLCYII